MDFRDKESIQSTMKKLRTHARDTGQKDRLEPVQALLTFFLSVYVHKMSEVRRVTPGAASAHGRVSQPLSSALTSRPPASQMMPVE